MCLHRTASRVMCNLTDALSTWLLSIKIGKVTRRHTICSYKHFAEGRCAVVEASRPTSLCFLPVLSKACLDANLPAGRLLVHPALACVLPALSLFWLPPVRPQTVFLLHPMADSCLHNVVMDLEHTRPRHSHCLMRHQMTCVKVCLSGHVCA